MKSFQSLALASVLGLSALPALAGQSIESESSAVESVSCRPQTQQDTKGLVLGATVTVTSGAETQLVLLLKNGKSIGGNLVAAEDGSLELDPVVERAIGISALIVHSRGASRLYIISSKAPDQSFNCFD